MNKASAIRAFGMAIQTPAIGTFLPQLAPTEKLTKVNATNSIIQLLVMLVSPMLSGALMTMKSLGQEPSFETGLIHI